jgi:hypothetical protein
MITNGLTKALPK